jgi:hypothetical protein
VLTCRAVALAQQEARRSAGPLTWDGGSEVASPEWQRVTSRFQSGGEDADEGGDER